MNEFLAVTWYVVPAAIIAIISAFAFIVAGFGFVIAKVDEDEIAAEEAAIGAMIALGLAFIGAWLWPILIPCGILFLLYKMIETLIPKKEK